MASGQPDFGWWNFESIQTPRRFDMAADSYLPHSPGPYQPPAYLDQVFLRTEGFA